MRKCDARRTAPRLAATLLPLLLAGPAAAGPAIGQFELKTLESHPGYLEFQSQNAYSWGQPRRRIDASDPSEPLYDDNSVTRQRHALEVEAGWTDFFKTRVGIEYEKERVEEPTGRWNADAFEDLKLSEVGGEAIVIFIPREGDGFGLGAVAEYERPLESGEASHFILGPIIEVVSGPWALSAVPMVVHAFGGEAEPGEQRDDKWDFAYAASLTYTFTEQWALALEAYGTVERIGDTGAPSEAARRFGDADQHRIGPILYYSYTMDRRSGAGGDDDDEGSEISIGLGFLAGLTENTPDGTLKLSVEVEY